MTTPVVVENFLAHYGVKGMRWGVKKSSSQKASASSAQKKPDWAADPPNAPSSSSGGKKGGKSKAELSPDAQVFNALRQKAKEGGVNALSNDEIRVLAARAEALDKYARTFPAQKTRKQKIASFVVQEVLVGTGKTLVKDVTKHAAQDALRKKGLLPSKDQGKKKDDEQNGGTP